MKIAATAANESWKPGSSRLYGFQPSSKAAPSNRKYQRSRGRDASHASDASAPATPARTTDGCQPTAMTYAPIAASAPTSAASREMPSSHAASRTPPATNATFCPETANRWYRPDDRKRSRSSSLRPSSSPRTRPARTARRSPDRPGAIEAASRRRIRSTRRRSRLAGRRPASSGRGRRRARRGVVGPRARRSRRAARAALAARPRSRSARPAEEPGPTGARGARLRGAPSAGTREPCAGTRSWNGVRRAGPVISITDGPTSPIRGASTLRSRASRRTLPHQRPPSARATASAASRLRSSSIADGRDDRRQRGDEQPWHAGPNRVRCGEAERRARPRARAERSDRETAPSRSHELPQLLEPGRADSGNRVEVVDRAEGTVLLAPIDDLLRRHGPHAGQLVQLLDRRRVEMNGPSRRAVAASPPAACRGRRRRDAGTTTCVPSETGAARLTRLRSARRVAPPARRRASAIRAPFARR